MIVVLAVAVVVGVVVGVWCSVGQHPAAAASRRHGHRFLRYCAGRLAFDALFRRRLP